MATIRRQVEAAIEIMASRPSAFSAAEVEAYADMGEMKESIEDILRAQSMRQPANILAVSHGNAADEPRYLGVTWGRKWWIESTLRWSKVDINYVTSTQLAGAMSAALDTHIWVVPPSGLLEIGLQSHMIAEGCIPGTFVFPWASLLGCHPRLKLAFQEIFDPEQPFPLPGLSLNDSIKKALNALNSRETTVVQLRSGLSDRRKHTLEEIGRKLGVSRERIRQIEARALRKLHHPRHSLFFLSGVAAEFMRANGSLLIPESRMSPEFSLATEALSLDLSQIKELGIKLLTKRDLSEYQAYLRDDDNFQSGLNSQALAQMLPFLPKSDAERLCTAKEEYRNKYANEHWSRPRMILEALRSIGHVAHYQEIATKCNELFPDRQTTIRNWYGALSRDNMEELGIVWVGRKGMYGLKEQGYTRPTMGLYDVIPEIVEREFLRTKQPVTDQVVIAELRKDRKELDLTSVTMVLGFSNRIEPLGSGKYVPKAHNPIRSDKIPGSGFDISAAFQAFTEEDAD